MWLAPPPVTSCAMGSLHRSRRTDLNARQRTDSNRRGHDETFNNTLRVAQSLSSFLGPL